MTSGREALHRIDAAIAAARRTLAEASAAAAGDARALAGVDQREVAALRRVAEIRLAHLKADDANGGALGAADREAERLVSLHDRHVADLEEEVASAKTEIEAGEARRRDAEAAHAAALAAHDEAAARTHERLEQDPVYRQRAEAVEAANAIAARAAQKLQVALEDRKTKGAAFEADPLFVYLHQRKFGTRDYKAFALFAMLDAWVARIIRYRDHALNYARLIELPERLAEHAARVEAEADATERALETLEREAMERDGVGALREKVGALASEIERIDAEIGAAESKHAEAQTALTAAISGDSGPLAEARALLLSAMGRLGVPDLRSLAAETATPEDDRLVDGLIRIRRERMELEEAKRSASRTLEHHGRALSELEDLRRRFKGARFDSPYSEFSGRDLIGMLLSEFLRGALSRDDLWRRIERAHRTRRRDWDHDIGGDEWRDVFGLPGGWGGSDWGGWSDGRSAPRAPRGPSPVRIPRAPRARIPSGRGRPSGGFKTGGGF